MREGKSKKILVSFVVILIVGWLTTEERMYGQKKKSKNEKKKDGDLRTSDCGHDLCGDVRTGRT